MPDKEWLYPNLHENGYTYSVLENLHYIPHVHGGLECVYVLDGELCATIDEKNYTLKKGDIFLISRKCATAIERPITATSSASPCSTIPCPTICVRSSSMAMHSPTRFTVQEAIRHSSPKLLTTC